MEDKIKELQKWIDESENIVFFGGAGVSTASGIKDFRSPDGLYSVKFKYSPEEMLSADMLYRDPSAFYEFYRTYLNCLDAKPNETHYYLADLEKEGKLSAVVTQNIDGLHTKAGSKNVLEIHGTVYQNYCDKCGKEYDEHYIFDSKDIPLCDCGGMVRPRVVLYGESLPDSFDKARDYIYKADVLIVAGTSLNVYPAANLIRYYEGTKLVLINKDKTPYDHMADLIIHGDMKKVFEKLD